jgi:hypothetical protein
MLSEDLRENYAIYFTSILLMWALAVAKLPEIIVHGDNDPTVSVEESRAMVAKFKHWTKRTSLRRSRSIRITCCTERHRAPIFLSEV